MCPASCHSETLCHLHLHCPHTTSKRVLCESHPCCETYYLNLYPIILPFLQLRLEALLLLYPFCSTAV